MELQILQPIINMLFFRQVAIGWKVSKEDF
jgi:hypothetical protein